MRLLKQREIDKRGCKFCADKTLVNEHSNCPHEECPYHELDKVKNYKEYMKKRSEFSISELLRTMK